MRTNVVICVVKLSRTVHHTLYIYITEGETGTQWCSWLRHSTTSRKVAGSILLIPVAERSKARFCGRWLAGIAGSNPAGGMDVSVVCCRVKTKVKVRGNQDKEPSSDEVQSEYKRIQKKIRVGSLEFFSDLILVTLWPWSRLSL